MKVQDTNLTGTSGLPPSGAATRQAGLAPPPAAKSGNGDRVELSGFAGKLGATLAAQSQDRAVRVAAIERNYQSGRYSADSNATSRALVTETVAATAADKEAG